MVKLNAGYDVVVVGDGLPLLSAGLTLVRNGARALMVPLSRQEQPQGQQFAEVQSPFIEGVDLANTLRELGLAPAELKSLAPIAPSFQAILPNKRLELSGDDAQWLQECGREYDTLSVDNCRNWSKLSRSCHEMALKASHNLSTFTLLPPSGMKQRFRNRHASSRLHAVHKGRNFRSGEDFWDLIARGLGLMLSSAVPTTPLHQGNADQLIALARWGSLDGRTLSALLRQHLQKRNAEFLQRGQLQMILGKRRQLESLKLLGADVDTLHFGSMILATHPNRLLPLLEPALAWRPLMKWMGKHPIIYDRYIVPITILKEGFPVGMSPRALMISDPERALAQDNLLLVDHEESRDGKSVLWVRFLLHHGKPLDNALMERILTHLKTVMPFLNENIIAPLPDPKLHGYLYGPAEVHRQCLLFGASVHTPFRNLYLASSANLPELGMEGELLVGMKTAQNVLLSRIKRDHGGLVLERNSIS